MYKNVRYTNINPITNIPLENSNLLKRRRSKGPVVVIPEDIKTYDKVIVFFDWQAMRENIDYKIIGNKIIPLGQINNTTAVFVDLFSEL